MAITLGRLVGLGFCLFWIGLALYVLHSPIDWTEMIITNPEPAAGLFRAMTVVAMIWVGIKCYTKIGVLVDDVVKLWAVWSTKKKKSE